jgi:ferredoxin
VKYKIEIKREDCIRCGSCYAIDQDHFEGDSDGKSQVIGGTTKETKSEGFFNDEKMVYAQAAADACPVSIITVSKSN